MFFKKTAFKSFAKFAGKHLCLSPFFNRPVTLLKRRLLRRFFPVNFAKFLRFLCFIEGLPWLFLFYIEQLRATVSSESNVAWFSILLIFSWLSSRHNVWWNIKMSELPIKFISRPTSSINLQTMSEWLSYRIGESGQHKSMQRLGQFYHQTFGDTAQKMKFSNKGSLSKCD